MLNVERGLKAEGVETLWSQYKVLYRDNMVNKVFKIWQGLINQHNMIWRKVQVEKNVIIRSIRYSYDMPHVITLKIVTAQFYGSLLGSDRTLLEPDMLRSMSLHHRAPLLSTSLSLHVLSPWIIRPTAATDSKTTLPYSPATVLIVCRLRQKSNIVYVCMCIELLSTPAKTGKDKVELIFHFQQNRCRYLTITAALVVTWQLLSPPWTPLFTKYEAICLQAKAWHKANLQQKKHKDAAMLPSNLHLNLCISDLKL